MQPWEQFLQKYIAFGQQPSKERHAGLFTADATIFHPGMPDPMPAAVYVDFIAEGLKRLPDFHLIPVHWAVNGDTVFVEARNTATVNRRAVVWPATYVVTLCEEMVVRGRAYYDRTEALAPFEPILATTVPNAHTTMLEEATPFGASPADDPAYAAAVFEQIVRPYAENGKNLDPLKFQHFYTADARMINPGFVRPLRRDELPAYYTGLKAEIRNLQLHLQRWAVAPGLLFIEWTVTGELAGKQLQLANTDRFTLRDMQVIEGVAYFDNLLLRALVEPELARFTTVSFADVPIKDNQE